MYKLKLKDSMEFSKLKLMPTRKYVRRARATLDRRLAQMGQTELYAPPRMGWIRAIRDALGMSAAQLGRRLSASGAAVSGLERSERDGTIKLATLRKVAAALDCTVVYALVPNTSLSDTVRHQAETVAAKHSAVVAHTMALEAQDTEPSDQARNDAIEAIVASGRMWDT